MMVIRLLQATKKKIKGGEHSSLKDVSVLQRLKLRRNPRTSVLLLLNRPAWMKHAGILVELATIIV